MPHCRHFAPNWATRETFVLFLFFSSANFIIYFSDCDYSADFYIDFMTANMNINYENSPFISKVQMKQEVISPLDSEFTSFLILYFVGSRDVRGIKPPKSHKSTAAHV